VLVGTRLEKERWKMEAPRYRILHLATHGVLNSNSPLSSYLVMNGDNVLTAREILKMNLDADLTVLSACETARGKFRFGEGMIGMSWAFLVAGAPTTVVSQWKVDAAATSQLMVAFHRNLKVKSGEHLSGRAEALRQAGLQLLASPQYKHPFYWAGFVMIGNGY
jgi:CHAT domain-containing protein